VLPATKRKQRNQGLECADLAWKEEGVVKGAELI
jgi:hypothetical protein